MRDNPEPRISVHKALSMLSSCYVKRLCTTSWEIVVMFDIYTFSLRVPVYSSAEFIFAM